MTGQYPLTHGVFINDVASDPNCDSIARAFGAGGYRTAYIGKWHLYGSPASHYQRRRDPVPRPHQLGFEDWYSFECCHDYWESPYYPNDDPTEHRWQGYDLFAQSRHAADYIERHADDDQPFMLMLSWGRRISRCRPRRTGTGRCTLSRRWSRAIIKEALTKNTMKAGSPGERSTGSQWPRRRLVARTTSTKERRCVGSLMLVRGSAASGSIPN